MSHDEMSDRDEQQGEQEFDPYQMINQGYQPMIEENSFEFLIAKTRLDYFKDNNERLKQFFQQYHLSYSFNYTAASCTIANSYRTTDPTSLLIARQMIKLISRYMEIERAQRVFEPGVESEILTIDLCRSKEVFLKRRARFVGSNGQTLTALELLTNTNVKVYGTSAAVVGTAQGIKLMERIVRDCFGRNVLPSFWVKTLMVRRELEKMPDMKDMDWSDFMPKLPKSNGRRRKKVPRRQLKKPIEERGLHDVGAFAERKEDRQMAMGVHRRRGKAGK